MKICGHQGLVLAVLTGNEHCPPHVHTGTDQWDARFEFSFWHQSVRLWDVTPAKNKPSARLPEELRQTIKQPRNLRQARELWWSAMQSVCLIHQCWDAVAEEVVAVRDQRAGAVLIQAARFDVQNCKTVLQLAGRSQPVEIGL